MHGAGVIALQKIYYRASPMAECEAHAQWSSHTSFYSQNALQMAEGKKKKREREDTRRIEYNKYNLKLP